MKKIALTMFALLTTTGFVFAGGMGCSGYKQEILADKTNQEILITSNDLQLIKIIDQMGNTRFSVKNPDGTFQRVVLNIEMHQIPKEISENFRNMPEEMSAFKFSSMLQNH